MLYPHFLGYIVLEEQYSFKWTQESDMRGTV